METAHGTGSLGSLSVLLTADATKLIKGMNKAEIAVASSSDKMVTSLKTASGFIIGAFAAMAAAAAALTKKSIDSADALTKQAQIAGQSVEKFSALLYAANLANVSQSELAIASKFLTLWMEKNNIAAKDLTESIIQQADVFAAMKDGPDKIRMAYERFGRSGAQLIPLLNQGSAALRLQMQEAKALGLVIGPEFGHNSELFNDNIIRIQGFLTGVFNIVADKLLPAWIEMQERFLEWVKQNDAAVKAADALLKSYEALTVTVKVFALGLMTIWTALKSIATLIATSVLVQFEFWKNAILTYIEISKPWIKVIKAVTDGIVQMGKSAGDVATILLSLFKRDFIAAASAAMRVKDNFTDAFSDIILSVEEASVQSAKAAQAGVSRTMDVTLGLVKEGLGDIEEAWDAWLTAGDKLMKPIEVRAREASDATKKALSSIESDSQRVKEILEKLGMPQLGALDPFTSQLTGLDRELEENQKKLKVLEDLAAQELQLTDEVNAMKVKALEAYNKKLAELQAAQQIIVVQSAQNMFDALGTAAAGFAGEQSAIYKAMFAASKAFAIAESIIKIQQGVANALSLPFPANLAAMASVVAAAANIVSTIQSTQMVISGERAEGGPVSSGKSYLVGEQGPEIFTPSSSGGIIPNDLIGGGNNVRVNINNYTDVKPEVRERDDNGTKVIDVIIRRVKGELSSEIRDGRGDVSKSLESSFGLRRGR